jgi:hypothetical protein
VIVEAFIVSLKVALTAAPVDTPEAPLEGFVGSVTDGGIPACVTV